MRGVLLIAALLVLGSWYGVRRARVARARRAGRDAVNRWEAEGGAPAPSAERRD